MRGCAPAASLFAINAVLNIAWSPLFFKLRRPDWALVELVPSGRPSWRWSSPSARDLRRAPHCCCPYLAWVSFAGWLNWQVVRLNAPFPAARRWIDRRLLRSRHLELALIVVEGIALPSREVGKGHAPRGLSANLAAGA